MNTTRLTIASWVGKFHRRRGRRRGTNGIRNGDRRGCIAHQISVSGFIFKLQVWCQWPLTFFHS